MLYAIRCAVQMQVQTEPGLSLANILFHMSSNRYAPPRVHLVTKDQRMAIAGVPVYSDSSGEAAAIPDSG